MTAEGGRTVYVSGQVAFDGKRNIVGGNDVVEQTRQALRNFRMAVEAGGAQMRDVVKLTTCVVGYHPDQLAVITGVIAEFFPSDRFPTNTLIGVQSLSTAGLLVEIDGVAVTDSPVR